MRYIGVDLHTNSFTACYLDPAGVESFRTFRLSGPGLEAFRQTLVPDDEVAVEATGNSSFFREQVVAHVKRIVVVAPGQFQVIRKSVRRPTATMRAPWPSSCPRTCCRRRASRTRRTSSSPRWRTRATS